MDLRNLQINQVKCDRKQPCQWPPKKIASSGIELETSRLSVLSLTTTRLLSRALVEDDDDDEDDDDKDDNDVGYGNGFHLCP
ncbi:hypothetical protein E3N88_13193 [Mikania micrantha]|uniref:Uncharacterized protein n=1 Tax=Mikania micrantha TaxID=192012 RepID=A0A5N6P9L7_9ASTR|nr:hypothetical protein E3N88_13193 [Mikania micrantha]